MCSVIVVVEQRDGALSEPFTAELFDGYPPAIVVGEDWPRERRDLVLRVPFELPMLVAAQLPHYDLTTRQRIARLDVRRSEDLIRLHLWIARPHAPW
jgi:hypothetical protein